MTSATSDLPTTDAVVPDDLAPDEAPLPTTRSALVRGLAYGTLLLAFLLAFLTIILPAIVGAVPLTVLSNSMAPSMPTGSLAVVRPTKGTVVTQEQVVKTTDEVRGLNDVSGIGPGDVIVFQPHAGDPTLVMHRVRAVETSVHTASGQVRTTFTTRGDNLTVDDDPVRDYQVRGVVMYSVPLLGYVNDALNTGPAAARSTIAVAAIGYVIAVTCFLRTLRSRGGRRARATRRPRAPRPRS